MKKLFLAAVIVLWPLAAIPALADTVDLLSIWEADKPNDLGGVDEDGDAAVTDLRVILRNNPRSERALVMLANAYVTSGSQQLADDTFRQVLDINPGNIQAAVPVIKSLLEKQDSDRSEQVIENALVHSPDNEILRSIQAQIKLSNQDIDGGQKIISIIYQHFLLWRQSSGN